MVSYAGRSIKAIECLNFLSCRQPWLRAELCHLQRAGIDGEAQRISGRLSLGQSQRQRAGETIARGGRIHDLYRRCGLGEKARLSMLAGGHEDGSLRSQRDGYAGDTLLVESQRCRTRFFYLVYLPTCEQGDLPFIY